MTKSEKEKLNEKIAELEEKLAMLASNLDKQPSQTTHEKTFAEYEKEYFEKINMEKRKNAVIISPAELQTNPLDVMRNVSQANKKSVPLAGLVKTTDDGSLDDDTNTDKVPTSIHTFDNLDVCNCMCHNKGKFDCMECYDHPVHLKDNTVQEEEVYDEQKIQSLIEADKVKRLRNKKWHRFFTK